MKAAVTEAPGAMRIADVPDAGEPEDGEVLVRPEAVGLCGSDFHYFLGELGLWSGTRASRDTSSPGSSRPWGPTARGTSVPASASRSGR